MRLRGFTLIELMSALVILSLLALMSFRGLGAVLDARDQVRQESEKWKAVAAFFARFQRDLQLSAPSPVIGTSRRFEFSRLALAEGTDAPPRIAYGLNANREIELTQGPTRRPVLSAVAELELHYLEPALTWVEAWPRTERDPPLPNAVRLRLVLGSGEELVRVFSLKQ
jgi:general secretion pathway protein J